VRNATRPARPRTQSCAAVSADGRRWFLINASPDLRVQIEAFAPLRPAEGVRRGSGIEGVLLTNADLDHVLGLYLLREGMPLAIHAAPATRAALEDGLHIDAILARYCGVNWHEPAAELHPLPCRDGAPSGLLHAAFPIPGKAPKYVDATGTDRYDGSLGYRIVDEATGGRLVIMPDVAVLDEIGREQVAHCDALLIDGTFWSDDEMARMGVGTARAADMAHLPVGGPDGSLAALADLSVPRRIYMHINNTNPMLLEDSAEHAAVTAAGCEVGYDGLELTL
jgi:pyrroloquinoline quinone biosynthesis protein B